MRSFALFSSSLFAASVMAAPQAIDGIPTGVIQSIAGIFSSNPAAASELAAAFTGPAVMSAVAALSTQTDPGAAVSQVFAAAGSAVTGSDRALITSALGQIAGIATASGVTVNPTANPTAGAGATASSSRNAAPTAGAGLLAGGAMAGAVAAVVMVL